MGRMAGLDDFYEAVGCVSKTQAHAARQLDFESESRKIAYYESLNGAVVFRAAADCVSAIDVRHNYHTLWEVA